MNVMISIIKRVNTTCFEVTNDSLESRYNFIRCYKGIFRYDTRRIQDKSSLDCQGWK